MTFSGLAWHTEEATLRQKFEEFGVVEEAVSNPDLDMESSPSLYSASHRIVLAHAADASFQVSNSERHDSFK